jgi:Transcriptional regulator, AbiEi antitoxin/Protein of unknown function (DUF559)
MPNKGAKPDLTVAAIAARQHGAISTRQLHDAGLGRASISERVAGGRLHRVHHGAYAVGHRGLSQQGIWMAAVLACDRDGRAACLSHRSAAELWGLLSANRGLLDVSVPGGGGRKRRAGIRIHRSTTLAPGATTRRHRIPVTKPERTIADLRLTPPNRGGADARQLRRAIRQAGVLNLPIGEEDTLDPTRSDLEVDFLGICRHHGIAAPEVNAFVDDMEVDFLWRPQSVAVETDGYAYHRGRVAFEDDRTRALRLRELGFEVIRLSEVQVEQEPARIAAVLRQALGQRD